MDDQLVEFLNTQVANWTVLYMKLHNYHWFITGAHFYQLHELFEKLYNEAHENLDSLAERVLILGEEPVATLADVLSLATIKEATGEESEEEMLDSIINDFQLVVADLSEGLNVATDEGDDVTIDILVGIQGKLQKHLWMLISTLA
ncbi:MAG: Non-specific DNA-binding protein Dps Iron-binding ferritin-like antioxidant protein Ferroxidase [Haloplasmataceae bacterium]|jgi:starvation-inducible DNA-binding protein|nr:Non-specific DNA-binding protein Dps Iron-binding ferritin-like antioxidant protein Ferroxidase [Haloplasmataceae bacterium]